MGFIELASFMLLAIGLYASVYGIDHEHLKSQVKKIATLLSVGVLFKTLIMTLGLMTLFDVQLGYAWLFSLAIAQIDPIGTAKYIEGSSASPKVQSILRTVSSFDDPITVILTVVGIGLVGADNSSHINGYAFSLLKNIGFAAFFIPLSRALEPKLSMRTIHLVTIFVLGLVVWQQLFLGIAIAALFVRPKHYEKNLPNVLQIAFILSILILLPLIRLDGESILIGLGLGVLGYFAQVVVGFLLTIGMSSKERRSIMFAQFNGITSVILALFLSTQLGSGLYNIPALIAFAVLTVDLLYILFNKQLAAIKTKTS